MHYYSWSGLPILLHQLIRLRLVLLPVQPLFKLVLWKAECLSAHIYQHGANIICRTAHESLVCEDVVVQGYLLPLQPHVIFLLPRGKLRLQGNWIACLLLLLFAAKEFIDEPSRLPLPLLLL